MMTAEERKLLHDVKGQQVLNEATLALFDVASQVDPELKNNGNIAMMHDIVRGFQVMGILAGEIKRLTEEIAGLKGRLAKMEEGVNRGGE